MVISSRRKYTYCLASSEDCTMYIVMPCLWMGGIVTLTYDVATETLIALKDTV
jgi:hypothetical protein